MSSIGITEAARARDLDQVGYTSVQGITIRDHPGHDPDTTDGSARIFLNTSAFGGGYYSLQEVLVHELIHVAGVEGVDPGWFWEKIGYHDLSHFEGHDEIMEACTK